MAFMYLTEPESPPSTNVGASQEQPAYAWVACIVVVLALLVLVVAGITIVAVKIKRIKSVRRQTKEKGAECEVKTMSIGEEEGVVRMDATVSNSDA